jgi:repressor LexA
VRTAGLPLTDAQANVLAFIARYVDEEGAPPTFRDIAGNFGFKSTRAAQDHVAALVRKGKLERIPGVARGLRLTAEATGPQIDSLCVPILGEVGASAPREAWEANMGMVPFPRDQVRGKNAERDLFALKVSGESMIGAGIQDGDVAIVRAQSTAAHGEIVVVLWDGRSTLKRFWKMGGRIRLVPENPRMRPIPVNQGEFSIQGKVIAVQRYYK